MILKPKLSPTHVTAYRKGQKSKTITVYETSPEQVIESLKRLAGGQPITRRRVKSEPAV
jgi:hypothetical protein